MWPNSEPGVAFTFGDTMIRVVPLHIEGGVQAVEMTRRPDKLSHWSVPEIESASSFQSP